MILPPIKSCNQVLLDTHKFLRLQSFNNPAGRAIGPEDLRAGWIGEEATIATRQADGIAG
jgi:hypothetical protein